MGLPTARRRHIATLLLDGKVLITGGVVSGQGTVSLAEAMVYDPGTGAFSATGSMGKDRANHRATRLVDGRVLITGGVTVLTDGHVHSYGSFPHAEMYDPTTGAFAPAGLMPTALSGHTSTLLTNGDVLVIGVSSGWRPRHAALYDPTNGKFTPTGNPLTLRAGHTATRLSSGQVLITGGKWKGIIASAELYDPTTGSFSATGSMNIGRAEHTAALLSNGKVLITGGQDNAPRDRPNTPRVFDSAELYDPSTGVFTPTGSMAAARGYHSSILVRDSNVLVVGGLGADGLLASAEVFHP